MRTHRFGRKIKLPATIAIKHQIRMRMAQYEVKRAEVEARAEVFRGKPGPIACKMISTDFVNHWRGLTVAVTFRGI
jgi:hypothetical protein